MCILICYAFQNVILYEVYKVTVRICFVQGKVAVWLKTFVNADFPGYARHLTGYLAIVLGAGLTMLVQVRMFRDTLYIAEAMLDTCSQGSHTAFTWRDDQKEDNC